MNVNTQAAADARFARSGKDGALYNSKGVLLATTESFSSKAAISTQDYKPLGTMNGQVVVNGSTVTLTMAFFVVESDILFQEFMEGLKTGVFPDWNFTGVLYGDNGSEERIVYRKCVPTGDWDIQNITPGELVKRNASMQCNEAPDLQSKLRR